MEVIPPTPAPSTQLALAPQQQPAAVATVKPYTEVLRQLTLEEPVQPYPASALAGRPEAYNAVEAEPVELDYIQVNDVPSNSKEPSETKFRFLITLGVANMSEQLRDVLVELPHRVVEIPTQSMGKPFGTENDPRATEKHATAKALEFALRWMDYHYQHPLVLPDSDPIKRMDAKNIDPFDRQLLQQAVDEEQRELDEVQKRDPVAFKRAVESNLIPDNPYNLVKEIMVMANYLGAHVPSEQGKAGKGLQHAGLVDSCAKFMALAVEGKAPMDASKILGFKFTQPEEKGKGGQGTTKP